MTVQMGSEYFGSQVRSFFDVFFIFIGLIQHYQVYILESQSSLSSI